MFLAKNTLAPGGSVAGEALDEPQGPNARGAGRKSCQAPNRQGGIYQRSVKTGRIAWSGGSLYQHTRAVVRNRGNDSKESKMSSRKWADSECGIRIGGNGEDWKTISISQRWIYIKDSFSRHVLVGPYGIYEILTGDNREEMNPRRNLRIREAGNAGVAAISGMVEAIEGIVGCRAIA